jgi:hypothetical protein
MFLSAIGDTGFAYSTTPGPNKLQRDVWIWNLIFNADHLCNAAALIGYRYFFSFNRADMTLKIEGVTKLCINIQMNCDVDQKRVRFL